MKFSWLPPARTLALIAALLVMASLTFAVTSCLKQRNAAAQARTDASQAQAASESAKDAIGTVSRAGDAQAASEQLTRENEQMIRAAEGAAVKVGPAVQDAGLRALCSRAAYKDAPRCAAFKGTKR